MSQTNVDYLFQLTSPVADRAFSSARSNDGGEAFDDHLSQASTIARDDAYRTGNSEPASETQAPVSRQSTNDPSSRDSGPATPTAETKSRDKEKSHQTESSPEQDDYSRALTAENEAADKGETDDHDADKPDEKGAAELGATAQAATAQPQKKSTVTSAENTTLSAATKTNAQNDKTATHADRQVTNGGSPASLSEPQASELTAQVVAATDAAVETAQHLVVATGEVEQSSEPTAEVARTTVEKSTARHANSKANGDTSDGDTIQNRPTADGAGTIEIATDAAQAAEYSQQSSALSAPSVANHVSNDDGSKPDDERRSSRVDSRGNSRSDAATPTKTDAALLANVPTTNAADASATSQPKGEKNEQAAKPVTAKGEAAVASLTRMARASAGANGGGRTATANDAPRIDPARFVGRVAKAFQTAQDRGGTLQLRLSPPDLGSLRLELSVKDGVMSAALQTENANARRLLLDHLPALRDRLAEQNIRVDRFDVDVRREGTGGQADTRGSQQQQFQHQPQEPAPRRQTPVLPRERETTPQDILPVAPSISDAGLNLIV